LCYPDEGASLAKECLEAYDGDIIIHVGELAFVSGTLSSPQAPWGRTTSAEFQVALAEEFHCLLNVSIPRYPISRDCISVWKRTRWVEGKPSMEDDEQDEVNSANQSGDDASDGSGSDSSEVKRQDNMWASIPPDERLPVDIVAPALAHLLAK
jgi:hypothetical protein